MNMSKLMLGIEDSFQYQSLLLDLDNNDLKGIIELKHMSPMDVIQKTNPDFENEIKQLNFAE